MKFHGFVRVARVLCELKTEVFMQILCYVSFLHVEYSKSSVIVLNKVMNMAEDLRPGMDTRLQRLENKSRSKALTPITPPWI